MTVTPKTRREVIARDRQTCQWCGIWVDVTAGAYSLQHRRARGMGGSKRIDTDLPSNLVTMCGSGVTGCHGYIESHRDAARQRGFTLRDRDRPELVPVLDHIGQWLRFDALGGRELISEIDAVEYLLLIGVHQIKTTDAIPRGTM
jgi:hypothetical protein